MKMSIAKGLVYKKRVIEKIREISQLIIQYNSVEVFDGEENREEYNIEDLMKRYSELKNYLVDLKILLWENSKDIRKKILLLAEYKDKIIFLGGIPTRNGKFNSGYGESKPSVFSAILSVQKLKTFIEVHKKAIDQLQSEIEEFNNNTFFEIDQMLD
jgi:hypothetical protein